jgi:hypothetical protein
MDITAFDRALDDVSTSLETFAEVRFRDVASCTNEL